MWRYAHKIISELGFKVKLCNGTKTKKIVGQKKTDYNDAKVLADLARTNYLDELYIPDETIIKYRDLTHHLKSLRET
jgi:transposase